MASQYGTNRIYLDDTESNDTRKVQCPKCHVFVVPRGISASRSTDTAIGTHCPNCGHVFGTDNH